MTDLRLLAERNELDASVASDRAREGVQRIVVERDDPAFIGGTPEPGQPAMKRLELFLPEPVSAPEDQLDPLLRGLLMGGRATSSSFDIAPSPVADFLYVSMGEPRLMKGFQESKAYWEQKISPRIFLSLQPRDEMLAIATACMEMAPTRSKALEELKKLL